MGFSGGGWWSYISHDETEKPQINRVLLLRIWHFARPYRWQVLALLLTIAIISLLGLVPPLLFRDLIDNTLPNRDAQRLNWLALGMVAVPVITGLVGVWQRNLSARVGEGVIYDLRRALYDHVQRMSLRFFTETRTGELMSRLNNDVVGAQSAVTGTLISIASNVVSLVATLAIMLRLEWRLTLLALAILPGFIISARRIGGVLRRLRRKSMEYNAEMNAQMNETLNVSGALLVKLFGRTAVETNRFASRAADVRDIGVRSAVIGRWFFLFLSITSAIGTALVFWLGGHLVLGGAFTAGTIVAFGTYVTQLYGPLTALTNAPVEFAQSMVSFERVFEALDLPHEITDKPTAVALGSAQGAIRFEQVYFRYQAEQPSGLTEVQRFGRSGRHGGGGGTLDLVKRGKAAEGDDEATPVITRIADREWALEDINLTIEPGQLVALVGPSGAGKTTMTYLIPRLYDPLHGRITLDGHDLRDVTLDSLSANIGMVTQETYLFYDTIRANLLYANPTASEAQMIEAAQAANIHDFITSLPDGYDTVVGERGYRLSGGERQRVAIARVILKDPRILVLDEATSSLDSLSEALIQQALKRVMAGRTSLVIAHRLSTILSADKIVVFRLGRIVEQGTHADLLAADGLYAELYHTQFKHTRAILDADAAAAELAAETA